ncbi:aromatic compound dioxygenase, partial [Fistulina hepatica ATCC 64428]
TCVLAPEVAEESYYINNDFVRWNLTDDQPGTPLVLDLGVIDVTTCEPLPNAFVEIWHSNATGFYSSYPATQGGADLARSILFLRGGYATNAEGATEFVTIYPGYTEGRANHINAMVHLNWEKAENGTIISHSGSVVHIGELFFDEDWNNKILSLYPYTLNTNSRTANDDDDNFTQANSDGYSAVIDLELLGDDLSDGLVGYITIGVDPSAAYEITNNKYLSSVGA